ncbi:PadR family transcriptional regulator [Arthrobacter sp. Hor0625]|uniref:PadR family transcriptional regulator n=1 Tax=Arthrobacter sp. Hor0625 TaxID=3457358 RepID=UPI00403EAE5B
MTKREMREPTFLVLSALARGRQHGYSLIAETNRLSQGRVKLQPGSLYATLDRLSEEGSITVDGEEIIDRRLRRYYRLTNQGEQQLRSEIDRLEANVTAARASLQIRTAGGFA